jgi:hypothetical protein
VPANFVKPLCIVHQKSRKFFLKDIAEGVELWNTAATNKESIKFIRYVAAQTAHQALLQVVYEDEVVKTKTKYVNRVPMFLPMGRRKLPMDEKEIEEMGPEFYDGIPIHYFLELGSDVE